MPGEAVALVQTAWGVCQRAALLKSCHLSPLGRREGPQRGQQTRPKSSSTVLRNLRNWVKASSTHMHNLEIWGCVNARKIISKATNG